MRASAAILTMIGLARTQPIKSPCRPVSSDAEGRPTSNPRPKPSQLTARMNTIAVTPTVAPSANDMMFPLIVISVMPIATQPMNDTVVSSDRMLGPARKPGVVEDDGEQGRRCRCVCAAGEQPRLGRAKGERIGRRRDSRVGTGHRALGHAIACVGWVMSARIEDMAMSSPS